MSSCQEKLLVRAASKAKTQFEERASIQTRLRHSRDVGTMRPELKTTIIDMLRALTAEVGMGTASREMETLRKNQKEMLETKSAVTEMKAAFDGLICRLDTVGSSVSSMLHQ